MNNKIKTKTKKTKKKEKQIEKKYIPYITDVALLGFFIIDY